MQGFAAKISDHEGATEVLTQIMLESEEFAVRKDNTEAVPCWAVRVRAPGKNTDLKFSLDVSSREIFNTLEQLLASLRKKNAPEAVPQPVLQAVKPAKPAKVKEEKAFAEDEPVKSDGKAAVAVPVASSLVEKVADKSKGDKK